MNTKKQTINKLKKKKKKHGIYNPKQKIQYKLQTRKIATEK